MDVPYERELQQARVELQAAQVELDELRQQIQSFEAQVDSYIGSLLDQLSGVNSEINTLNDALHQIREERLFGKDRIRNLVGTTLQSSTFPWDEPYSVYGFHSQDSSVTGGAPAEVQKYQQPDIKHLYRMLARRYHPDLARTDSERYHQNEVMVEINQLYQEENLEKLMEMAGLEVPFYIKMRQGRRKSKQSGPQTELEKVKQELSEVQAKIIRLGSLPSVKLSLDVKLARFQGRDLLAEMAIDLRLRLDRRNAQRDYLRAQVRSNTEFSED